MSNKMNDIILEANFEASQEHFMETGKCDWCLDKKEITYNAGLDNEYTEKCPVCSPKNDME
jgi:hypothetical protein